MGTITMLLAALILTKLVEPSIRESTQPISRAFDSYVPALSDLVHFLYRGVYLRNFQ
jgi:hypothetical protein